MGALAADMSGLSLLPSAMTLEQMVLLAGTTFIAAGVNSIAGGGTILTFPVVAAFLPDGPARLVIANATSTIGLWPGSLAAAWATRSERHGQPRWTRWLLPASVGGAIVGTMLVLTLPPAWFSRLVPWLILSAALLFALQPRLSARLGAAGRNAGTTAGEPTQAMFLSVWVLQFLVAVYGGYFGAGIGILMLAVLGCLGLGDIHRINALKNVLATAVNGTSSDGFQTLVSPHTAAMAAFQLQTATGKLKAEIMPMGPRGCHCSYMRCWGRSLCMVKPYNWRLRPTAKSQMSIIS